MCLQVTYFVKNASLSLCVQTEYNVTSPVTGYLQFKLSCLLLDRGILSTEDKCST